MPGGPPRAASLSPDRFLRFVKELVREGKIADEVFARRFMSALFFALFNYWAARRWDSGSRGRGPRQDRFPYTLFVRDMLSRGLDRPIMFIYLRRTLADHYVLNPTIVRVWERALLPSGERVRVSLSPRDMQIALEAARELLKGIEA